MRTMYVNISYASEVLVAVCYHLLLEVVDTLSHKANFVVLNSGNEISSHIVFVLVVVLFFIYAAKVLLFFDMCKFLVQKNAFFVSFFQYHTYKRKNATLKHDKKPRRAIAARRGTHKHNRYISMKPNAKILHINDICKFYLYFCKTNSQKPFCHVASDHTHSQQSYR